MPRDLFQEAGITPNNAPRDLFAEAGISPDQDNGINPSAFQNKPRSLINYEDMPFANRNPVDTVRDLTQGILSGLTKGGQKVAHLLYGNRVPTIDVDEVYSKVGSGKNDKLGNLVKGIGEYLPYAIAGGPSALGQITAGGVAGASLSDPNQRNLLGILPNGSSGAAIEGAALNAIPLGIGKILETLRPSNLFRGNLTPDELKRNLEITQGTETGLGDVIGSPFLKKRLENTLTSVPFSGANESLQRTHKLVTQKGNNILDNLLGENDSSNVPLDLAKELENQHTLHRNEKNRLYDKFNQLADDSNINLELPSFSEKAKKYADAIESTNILKLEPDSAALFNKLKNYKEPVEIKKTTKSILDENGNPIIQENKIYPSFKEANLLKGKLNELANKSAKSPDITSRNLANIFGSLASSLKSDITDAVKNNEDLSSAYKNAEENYKNNFSPFLDRDIYKYTQGNSDPEKLVSDFIRTSPTKDLAGHLAKLSTKIPESKRNLLGYAYLSRSLDNDGVLNPIKLSTAIEKLGKNQFKTLFPDESLRNSLKNYSKLVKMNTDSLNLMYNPKTGQRISDTAATGLLAGIGHMLSGNVGALAATAIPLAGGKLMTKYLTNPEIRNSLVQEMIKNKPKFLPSGNRMTAYQTLAQALANQSPGGQ